MPKICLSSDLEEKIFAYIKNREINYFKTPEGRDLFYSFQAQIFNPIKDLIESLVNQEMKVDYWIDFKQLIELLSKPEEQDKTDEYTGINYLKKIHMKNEINKNLFIMNFIKIMRKKSKLRNFTKILLLKTS